MVSSQSNLHLWGKPTPPVFHLPQEPSAVQEVPVTSLAEGVTMSCSDVTDGTNSHHDVMQVTPGHHQLQGTLGVSLSVDARGDSDGDVAFSFLLRCVSPSNMTLGVPQEKFRVATVQ